MYTLSHRKNFDLDRCGLEERVSTASPCSELLEEECRESWSMLGMDEDTVSSLRAADVMEGARVVTSELLYPLWVSSAVWAAIERLVGILHVDVDEGRVLLRPSMKEGHLGESFSVLVVLRRP